MPRRELQVIRGLEAEVIRRLEAADGADDEYYVALAPEERLEILVDLEHRIA